MRRPKSEKERKPCVLLLALEHSRIRLGALRTRTDVPLVEFIYIYLVFIRMSGDSHQRRLWPLLLCLCDVFRALINSLVCCMFTEPIADLQQTGELGRTATISRVKKVKVHACSLSSVP